MRVIFSTAVQRVAKKLEETAVQVRKGVGYIHIYAHE
jgi:hypothetical protein